MAWSEKFAAHLVKREISQLDAVIELRALGLRVSQSQVHYWCRGSVPRAETRDIVETWSGGAVSSATDEPSGPDLAADDSGEHPAVVAPVARPSSA